MRGESCWRVVTLGLLSIAVASCGGRQADFGTLPQVEVPIEKQPEQDPTLFRDDEETSATKIVRNDPPDPAPLRTRDHFDITIEFNKGELKVLSVSSVRTKNPQSTPRRMGRFAFELWTGDQLIERLRFDFPLLAATDARDKDPLASGLVATTKVRIPASSRAREARVLDRKTRDELAIAWPPQTEAEPASPSSDTADSGAGSTDP